MRTLYLDCRTGASSDALMAALYELLEEKEQFCEIMNAILPHKMSVQKKMKVDIEGTQINIEKTSFPKGIKDELMFLSIPPEVCTYVKGIVHRMIAASVNMKDIVRRGEVLDNIIGVALAIHMLNPERIIVSPIQLGCTDIAPNKEAVLVPAAATLKLLKGVPCFGGQVQGERCTPLAAVLLAYFGEEFGAMPVMTIESVGCGISIVDASADELCVRAFWGQSTDYPQQSIVELCCNIDDMSAEALAFAGERLMEQGALDVSSMPLTMKKGRLGVRLAVLCQPRDERRMAEAIMRETTTNGVRALYCGKYLLKPSGKTVETAYGPMRVKCADGYGIHHEKPEYNDVAAAARARGLPFRTVWEEVLLEARKTTEKR